MHPDGNSSGTEGSIQKDLVCRYMLKKGEDAEGGPQAQEKIQMEDGS